MRLGTGKLVETLQLRLFLPLLSPILIAPLAWSADDRAASQQVDLLVEKAYQKHQVRPNPPTSDEAFVRRVYLDVVGRIPTVEEAKAFLDPEGPGNRAALIDKLLQSPGQVSHSFNYWADVLRVKSRMEGQAGEAYADWLKQALRDNKPYNVMVHELLTAEGYVWENGAVGYYLRDSGMPLDNMSNTTQIFLGTQLVCAQCHNHPFDKWTQKEYYQMAAYTYGVETNINPNKAAGIEKMSERRANRKKPRERDRYVTEALDDLLRPLSYGVRDAEKNLYLPDDYKYKDGKPGELVKPDTIFGNHASARREARRAYANWLTSAENPRFTRVIANRLWKRVMGVGLVEPLDDFRDDTVASNPELLAYLEKQMAAFQYDMRRFMRMIYNTRAYQREATTTDYVPEAYRFPGPALRRMSAEQLWDSVLTLTIPEVDQRKRYSSYKAEQDKLRKQAEVLLQRKPQEIMAVAEKMGGVERVFSSKEKGLRESVAAARDQKNAEAEKRLNKELRELEKSKNQELKAIAKQLEGGGSGAMAASTPMMMNSMEKKPAETAPKKAVEDMRWKDFHPDLARASELSSPAPEDHFLRLFGQSDRESIEAAHSEASVSQALAMLNGHTYDQLVNEKSELIKGLAALDSDEKKQDYLFLAFFTRLPTEGERALMQKQFAEQGADKAVKSLIWILLNTRELAFVR